ncbi:hypothetical protein HO133_009539 [Letharia lupina]|uniref:Uncharacterized protein n=1 Tax=Letharia lupina TaxID=560253 RepID=A0A8H6CL42_9LECA|nr:uncharacterized protein HO133_009539 [Letharia lupina]KAF6225539.1 hypothetical protein HO133_009539 [Letharia lupina]
MSTASGYRDRIEPGVEDEIEFAEEGARGGDAQTHEIDGISTEEAGGEGEPSGHFYEPSTPFNYQTVPMG